MKSIIGMTARKKILGDLDSNQDSRSQSPESYRWTIPEESDAGFLYATFF